MSHAKKSSHQRPGSGLSATSKSIEVGAGMFKDKCLALMDKVRDERVQVVITKHGNAVARLVPADVSVPNGFAYMRGTILDHGDIVSPDFAAWSEA